MNGKSAISYSWLISPPSKYWLLWICFSSTRFILHKQINRVTCSFLVKRSISGAGTSAFFMICTIRRDLSRSTGTWRWCRRTWRSKRQTRLVSQHKIKESRLCHPNILDFVVWASLINQHVIVFHDTSFLQINATKNPIFHLNQRVLPEVKPKF